MAVSFLKISLFCLLSFFLTFVHAKKNLAAKAIIRDRGMKGKVIGSLKFTQKARKTEVQIIGRLRGILPKDSEHGFHIHESGNILKDCLGAGAHFNPSNKNHGGLNDRNRHVGDLGNVRAVNGKISVYITDDVISLRSKSSNSILGKAIVLHRYEDDLGKYEGSNATRKAESTKTGNAGPRLGCGLIRLDKTSGTGGLGASFVVILASLLIN